MASLGQLSSGRDNNLNLIRMLAASAVLVSHAWPLTYGAGAREPLSGLFGHSLGTLSVYVFFLISGFLIAASFERRPQPLLFLKARALRLLPGLTVSLLLVALVLGPWVTDLSAAAYLAHPETWRFLLANVTLAFPQYTLPGVFESNPYPTVEGSIWTLVHEAACYLLLLCAGLCGLLQGRRVLLLVALYGAVWSLVLVHPELAPGRSRALLTLSLPFFVGMLGWRGRHGLSLRTLGWAALGLGVAWPLLRSTPAAFPALILFLAATTAWLAYAPGKAVRRYNRLGDYSYGAYVYAFPIQGLVMWAWAPATPLLQIALALPLTLVFAMLSWHLVERPALDLMRRKPAGAPMGAQQST